VIWKVVGAMQGAIALMTVLSVILSTDAEMGDRPRIYRVAGFIVGGVLALGAVRLLGLA
jgi:hypothetical protein